MTDAPLLRLNKLTLENYRCFEKVAIEFHPELTVLVAENGRGKTAVLEAIRTALSSFVDSITKTRGNGKLNHQDIRFIEGTMNEMVPLLPTKVAAEVYIAGKIYQWGVNRKSDNPNSRTVTKPVFHLTAIEELRKNADNSVTEEGKPVQLLPFVAAYNTQRFWSDQKEKSAYDRKQEARLYGYSGCLSPSSLKSLVDWYGTKIRERTDPSYRHAGTLNYLQPLIKAVNEAIGRILEPTKWEELDWDFNRKCLVIKHPKHGKLPIRALSDGVRITVALAMDIARRCFTLNPHLENKAILQTPGILLIDEIDLHLHPGWQQQIIPLLRKAFPSLQIVLSTHSPHVLSTVAKESIRIIRIHDGVGLVETPQFQTRGVESADVLAQIMGVDPIPQVDEATWLSKYRALIDQGVSDTEDAKDLREKLIKHFGEQHPVILECDRMIRLMNFKKRLPVSKNQK